MERRLLLAIALVASLGNSYTSLAQEILDGPPPTVRNNMHSCPTGFIVTGIHVGRNQLLCLGNFTNPLGRLRIRNEQADQGMRSDNQWPPDSLTRAAYNYSGQGMHWCGPNRFVTGVHVANNAFNCAEFAAGDNLNYTPRLGHVFLDVSPNRTARRDMHACPRGTVLVGAHFTTNTFLCAELPFCQRSEHCPSTSQQCETQSTSCDPDATNCLYTTGVCRRPGRITFRGENACQGATIGGLTDRSGNIVNLARNPAYENDEARSMRLRNVHGGTIIRVFDDPAGSQNDDWAQIRVMTTTGTNECVDTFEQSVTNSSVSMAYMRNPNETVNDLDDAVSRIEVYSAIVGLGGRCLDVNENNNAVQIFGCHNGPNQSWVYRVTGEITGPNGLCLEAAQSDISNWQIGEPRSAAVQIAPCNGQLNQKWSIRQSGRIRMFGDMCMDIRGGRSVEQTPVQIFPCHGQSNQRWTSSF